MANIRNAYAEAQALAITGTNGEAVGNATYKELSDHEFVIIVSDVAILSKKANQYSGLADNLPSGFNINRLHDIGTPRKMSIAFDYYDGKLRNTEWQQDSQAQH